MNCCDRLLVVFGIFAVWQFIMRWNRDKEVIAKPWQLYIKGNTEPIEVHHSAVVNFTRAAISYGNSPVKIYAHELKVNDREEILVNIHAKVNGPPLSFHRLDMTVDDTTTHEMQIYTHIQGTGTSSSMKSIILAPTSSLQFKYHFNDITNAQGLAKVSLFLTFHSGKFKLWDVSWSDVYKEKI